MSFYCPVCGERDTIKNINDRIICSNCETVLEANALLANVKEAYKVWLNYQYLKANGFLKKKK